MRSVVARRSRRLGWAALPLAIGCAAPLSLDVAPSCVAVLRFGGAYYGIENVQAQGALTPGAQVGEVERTIGCDDTPRPGDPLPPLVLEDGDSNFLPPGTRIHSVEGHAVGDRLAARPDTVWIFLRSGL